MSVLTAETPSKSAPARGAAVRGIHHLVFCTDDMKATVDFYVDVVGLPLIHVERVPPGLGVGPKNRGNPPYEECRHYFFDMGNDSLLAFFEIPKGAEPAANRNAVGGCQHCAFVVTHAQFKTLETKLAAQGVKYLPAVEQGVGMFGIYFYDPNGIRLEFACQPEQGETQELTSFFTQKKAAAAAELRSLPGATPEWVEQRLADMRD